MVSLQSLRYALTLAEELHFGRAAERHYIAPQAFGRHIQRLERELGARLFDRTSRRVTLTPAGRRLVEHAAEVLRRVDDLAEIVREAPPADSARVRVGVLGFGLADRWPELRDRVTALLPGVELVHVELDWDAQYDDVLAGRVDVGIVHDVGPVDGVRLDRALTAERVAVVPARSPLADARRLAPGDVADRPWIRMVGRHPGLAAWAGAAAQPANDAPSVRTPSAIPAAVATSGMLGVHGEPARRFFPRADVRFVPLDGPPAQVSVATREGDRRPGVEAFRQATRMLAAP